MNLNELFEFLGRLYAENVLLGKKVAALEAHQCECANNCCTKE